jgi:hypothetical protein
MRRLWPAQLLLALLLLRTPAARGEPTRLAVRWVAPVGCPTEDSVTRDIQARVGARPLRPGVEARVEAWPSEAGGWKANIEVSASGQTTRREVHGDTCESVARAAAVVVAVDAIVDAFGPPAAEAAGEPLTPRPPPSPPEPPALPTTPAAPPPSRGTAPLAVQATPGRPYGSPHLSIGASGVVDVGMLPSAAPGGEVHLAWEPSWWSAEVASTLLAPETGNLKINPGQGAEIWLLQLGGRLCGAYRTPLVQVGPCAGLHAGWLFANGVGTLTTTESGSALVALSSWGGRATVRLARHFRARFEAEAVVPFERPTFDIHNAGTVFRPSAATFRGGLGAEVAF